MEYLQYNYNTAPRPKQVSNGFYQRSMEQPLADPDADAGTDDRDDEGRDAAGGINAEQAEHEFAHKAAQDAHEDVSAE